MELFAFAFAAALGYYCKKIPRDKHNLQGLSSGDSRYEKPETSSSPFHSLSQRRQFRKVMFPDKQKVSDEKLSDDIQLDGPPAYEKGSTGGNECKMIEGLAPYSSFNVLSLSTLPPELLTNGNLNEDDFGNETGFNVREDSWKPSTSQAVSVHDSSRSRNPLKTRHGHRPLVKPLKSIESCNDHTAIENYVLSSRPSSSSRALRPLLVSDGTKIISRASRDSFNVYDGTEDIKLHMESKLKKIEYRLCLPPHPIYSDNVKNMKVKREKGRNTRYKMDSEDVFLKASHDATFLFCLGISMGLIASFLANMREVEKLRELLKQTENLVQDLQDELEMKDSVTVKELTRENSQLHERDHSTNDGRVPYSYTFGENMKNSTKEDEKEPHCVKPDEGSESFSKIEAELEVELQRLGLNLDAPSIEKRISDLLEVDPDSEADFAQGELTVVTINGQAQAESESNEEKEGGSTSHCGNYAVSPRELSLRLHEVIQSRLEERVDQLETALQSSQRKLKLMESGHQNHWKNVSNTEYSRFSAEESSLAQEDCNTMAQPLVMNLSGEALDAYNEAYDELLKIDESEDEYSQLMDYEINIQEEHHLSEGSMSWGQRSAVNDSFPHLMDKNQEVSSAIYANRETASEEHSSRLQELLDVGFSEEESSDCDDEMGQLIKQIVEKTKKGTPVLINAQKALFSMDELEH